MPRSLLDPLREPRLEDVDPDGEEFLALHREILRTKPMLQHLFTEYYELCVGLSRERFRGEGHEIEIGAGSSFLKDLYPDVISTDVKPSPWLDRVLDAQQMDYSDASVRAVYGINCFHHLPDPSRFLGELERVLSPGGGCVLLEPYYGPIARPVYRNLFKTEDFDTDQAEWTTPTEGPMMDANQALSYVVFIRDAALVRERHPGLRVTPYGPIDGYARYVLSGGLNFRQLVPTFAEPVVKATEWALRPLRRLLALHHIVLIEKR